MVMQQQQGESSGERVLTAVPLHFICSGTEEEKEEEERKVTEEKSERWERREEYGRR